MERMRQAASVADLKEFLLLIVGSHTPDSKVSHTPAQREKDRGKSESEMGGRERERGGGIERE